ncbi:hypothetical protein [[Phormidium ambiguum] IAM M-71]|uniref:hypothetical protein n=1 Tax=[Phormidium ambiguum] IAM M-71 TaxID=454136 RepID=UPI0011614267|nr:hypothetical protein [Phormidium ambiguum]
MSSEEKNQKPQTQAEKGFQTLRGTDRTQKKLQTLPSQDFSRQKATTEKNTYQSALKLQCVNLRPNNQ